MSHRDPSGYDGPPPADRQPRRRGEPGVPPAGGPDHPAGRHWEEAPPDWEAPARSPWDDPDEAPTGRLPRIPPASPDGGGRRRAPEPAPPNGPARQSGPPPRGGPGQPGRPGGPGQPGASGQFGGPGRSGAPGAFSQPGGPGPGGQVGSPGPGGRPAPSGAGQFGRPGQSGDPGTEQWPAAEGGQRREPVEPAAQPVPEEKKKGRTGRNMPAAIGVGVAMGAVVVASLFVWRPAFLVLIAVAAGIAVWEMVRAVGASGARAPLPPLLAGAVLTAATAWFGGADGLMFGLIVTVLTILVWRFGDGAAGYGADVTAGVLIAVYVPLLAGFAALLAVPADGDFRVLVMVAGVVLSDTGGFVAGVFLGKHPMAPSVSPKKSWEGFGGSMVAAGVGSAILLRLLFDVPIWQGLVFGLCVAVAAVVGDLAESLIKRDLKIKDMSQLLPGHGGLMDRLDSILFAAPTAYVLLQAMAPVG